MSWRLRIVRTWNGPMRSSEVVPSSVVSAVVASIALFTKH